MSSREAIAAEAIWRRMTVPERTRRKLLNDYRGAVRAELMAELAQPFEPEQTGYVAAHLGAPRRDPRVESVPCPRADCQAPPGDTCRRPYGPDYWLPAGLHHERHEALAERILAWALADIRENTPTPQYVVSPETTAPASPLMWADILAFYARLQPPKDDPTCSSSDAATNAATGIFRSGPAVY